MPNAYENQYDADQRKRELMQKGEFMLAKVFKAMFGVVWLVLKIIGGVAKNVLKTFGVPIN